MRRPFTLWPSLDLGLGAAGLGTLIFSYALGGGLWACLAACVVGGAALAHHRQMAAIEAQRRTENALAGLLHGPGDIDELAAIKAEEWSDLRLFDLLASLKTTCGGESVASPHKTAGENQTVAVAPGISLSLAHDAGYWYAQLTLKGVSARRFLTSGGPTVWQARGATPQEATASLARAMGKSRRAVLVESYAKRILDDDSVG